MQPESQFSIGPEAPEWHLNNRPQFRIPEVSGWHLNGTWTIGRSFTYLAVPSPSATFRFFSC